MIKEDCLLHMYQYKLWYSLHLYGLFLRHHFVTIENYNFMFIMTQMKLIIIIIFQLLELVAFTET